MLKIGGFSDGVTGVMQDQAMRLPESVERHADEMRAVIEKKVQAAYGEERKKFLMVCRWLAAGVASGIYLLLLRWLSLSGMNMSSGLEPALWQKALMVLLLLLAILAGFLALISPFIFLGAILEWLAAIYRRRKAMYPDDHPDLFPPRDTRPQEIRMNEDADEEHRRFRLACGSLVATGLGVAGYLVCQWAFASFKGSTSESMAKDVGLVMTMLGSSLSALVAVVAPFVFIVAGVRWLLAIRGRRQSGLILPRDGNS